MVLQEVQVSIDNVSGVVSADFTGKNAPFVNTDNFSLTHTIWSELDNDTDSANNSVFSVNDNHTDNETSTPINYTFSSDGAKTLNISIKDAANNITTTTRSITVDRTPPVRTSNSLSLLDNDSGTLPNRLKWPANLKQFNTEGKRFCNQRFVHRRNNRRFQTLHYGRQQFLANYEQQL